MTIFNLLDDFERRGLALSPNGDKVRCTPRELLTDADRQAIQENRAALLAILTVRQEAGLCHPSEYPKLIRPSRAHSAAIHAAEALLGCPLTFDGHLDERPRVKRPATDFSAVPLVKSSQARPVKTEAANSGA